MFWQYLATALIFTNWLQLNIFENIMNIFVNLMNMFAETVCKLVAANYSRPGNSIYMYINIYVCKGYGQPWYQRLTDQ